MLSDTIEHTAGRALLVGFSGGMDSTVLLHLLATAGRPSLRAIHVDHGLHADSGAWAEHCRASCASLGVPLAIVRVRVDADSALGPEGAARAARHTAFEAELGEDEVLVLAHHRDDQAETFLLRALRASGADGLGAMRAWRRFGRGWLWRPLLDTPRTELSDHARRHGLHWIEDPTNVDTAFDRNFLRNRVLPVLRERWPHVDAAFACSAALSAEASVLLGGEDASALAMAGTSAPDTIDASVLRALDAPRRARVLRRWIETLGLPPLPASGIAAVESWPSDAASDHVAKFEWNGAVIHRWRNVLQAGRQCVPLPHGWQARWDGHAALSLPDGASLRLHGCTGFDAPLSVGARRGGERIRLAGRSHSHALKHVLQDRGVPPWLRLRLPLLSDARGDVLAAGDRVYAGAFETWLREHDAQLVWTTD